MANTGWSYQSYSPANPATNKPEWLYVNSDGTFRLEGASGVAEYVWPPYMFDDGTPRDNVTNLKSNRDDLEFVTWAIISTPGVQDEGWIFKVKGENFWFLFGDQVFRLGGQNLYRLYYSDDGRLFHRWRTEYGTRRSKPAPVPLSSIATPPGDVSQSVGPAPDTINIELGKHKKPNGLRFPCPSLAHPFGDTRDEWLKIWIEVKHPNVNAVIADVKKCAIAAAALAITAAIVTEGAALAAAEATFMASFKPCVQAALGSAASQLQASFKWATENGDWSGH